MGILVGPPFFDALKARVGSAALAVQGVNEYKASIAGYLVGGDVNGSANMWVLYFICLYILDLILC